MNFYAINEVPLNGWAWWHGYGHASMSMSASGRWSPVALGAGAAQTVIAASGNGTRRVPAYGSASIALMAAGEGTRRAPGTGIASMVMNAVGNGEVVPGIGGQATMMMVGRGRGGLLVFGQSTAQLELRGGGEGRCAPGRHGFGYAIMEPRAWDIPYHGSAHHGFGTAVRRLEMFGGGRLVAFNGGAAWLRIVATAQGRLASRLFGSGAAIMQLTAPRVVSDQYRQVMASGTAGMKLQVATRDNRVVTLPSAFYPANKVRMMRVATENRGMRVEKQSAAALSAEAA